MRNGNGMRGGRDKRMLGQMARAMDRTGEAAIHRVRGGAGINTHGRTPPTGPRGGAGAMQGPGARGGVGRGGMNSNRVASIQHGLGMQAMQGMQGGAGGMNGNWMMGGAAGQPPSQMEMLAMMEQQTRMMQQLSQQMMTGGAMGGSGHFVGGNPRHGRPLHERIQDPNGGRGGHRRGPPGGPHQQQHHHHQGGRPDVAGSNNGEAATAGEGGEDVDMHEKREAPNPDETLCKYNLRCTNKDCKFAHQSPAAPPGAHIDVHDICTFGPACKNRKCVGRHPSPAARLAHQSEQDCKFWPNCTNAYCAFRHPSMPPCRNGADCTTPNCKFTHVKTKCRYRPCLNQHCPFTHEEGQQGGFKDKVWIPGQSQEHVSERKFVDENAQEETILPDAEGSGAMAAEQGGIQEVVT